MPLFPHRNRDTASQGGDLQIAFPAGCRWQGLPPPRYTRNRRHCIPIASYPSRSDGDIPGVPCLNAYIVAPGGCADQPPVDGSGPIGSCRPVGEIQRVARRPAIGGRSNVWLVLDLGKNRPRIIPLTATATVEGEISRHRAYGDPASGSGEVMVIPPSMDRAWYEDEGAVSPLCYRI